MTLYDLYLDDNINGYIVFKTLSKRNVFNMIHDRYKNANCIQERDIKRLGECLCIDIQATYFIDYFDFYMQLMKNDKLLIKNECFHIPLQSSLSQIMESKIETVIIGTTKMFQSFIIKNNVRNRQVVFDIYFQNGDAYYYCDNQVYSLPNHNQFHKLMKRYNIENLSRISNEIENI